LIISLLLAAVLAEVWAPAAMVGLAAALADIKLELASLLLREIL
jgi:hypothetical protein